MLVHAFTWSKTMKNAGKEGAIINVGAFVKSALFYSVFLDIFGAQTQRKIKVNYLIYFSAIFKFFLFLGANRNKIAKLCCLFNSE